MKRKEGNFTNVSPFPMEKAVTGCAPSPLLEIRKAVGGLSRSTALMDQKGLRLHRIGDIKVEVISCTTLNTTNGAVMCSDLLNCTEEVFATEITPQGVIEFQRLTLRWDRQALPLHPMS